MSSLSTRMKPLKMWKESKVLKSFRIISYKAVLSLRPVDVIALIIVSSSFARVSVDVDESLMNPISNLVEFTEDRWYMICKIAASLTDRLRADILWTVLIGGMDSQNSRELNGLPCCVHSLDEII